MGCIRTFLLGVMLAPLAAQVAMATHCGSPVDLHDGWSLATPEQQGLDPDMICGIGTRLEGWREADAHGVVVVRHGAIVYEDYLAGNDLRWPERNWGEPLANMTHDASTKHDLQSITKSVVALLVGIALDRGLITKNDVPILALFPELADLREASRDRITLRDLLTMTAGLRWPWKPYLSMARQMDAARDPYRFVLEQPVVNEPGTTWHYNNGSAELAGAIVSKVTGRPLDQFAKETLFDPLGIADWEWGRMTSGDPGASWGLRLRPRDLAKIGQLVLDHGTWHEQQIVSAAWIREMTAPQITTQAGSYGYFWWLGRETINGRDIDWVGGLGWGGQCLYVVPSLDLIVVVTAGIYNYDGAGDQDIAGRTVLDQYVLPATLAN
jgi:CubicO group peptidase (beta-lactamase class C family)